MASQVLPAIAFADITSAAANASKNVSVFTQSGGAGNVYVNGTFVGTYDVEVSVDNTNFSPAHTGKTVPGVWALPAGAIFSRVRVTAFTSGTVKSQVGGTVRLS